MAFQIPKNVKRPVIKEEPKTQNGVQYPRAGSKSAKVWEIANYLTSEKVKRGLKGNERYALPAEVLADAKEIYGLHENSTRNDYQRWRKFFGVPRFTRSGTVTVVKKVRKRKPAKRKAKKAKAAPAKRIKAKVPPPPPNDAQRYQAKKAKAKKAKPKAKPKAKRKAKVEVPPPPPAE